MITSAPLRLEGNKKNLTELETKFTNQIAAQFIQQAQSEYETELNSLRANLEQQWQKNKEDCPVSNIEIRVYWILYILNCPKLIEVFTTEFEQKRIPREIFSDLYNKTFKNLNDPLLEKAFGEESTKSLPSIKEFISKYAHTILAKFFHSLTPANQAKLANTSIRDLFAAALSLAMAQIMDNPVPKKELCEQIFLTDLQTFKSAELLLISSLEYNLPTIKLNSESIDNHLDYRASISHIIHLISLSFIPTSTQLLRLKGSDITQTEKDFCNELCEKLNAIKKAYITATASEETSRAQAHSPQSFFTTRPKGPRNPHVLSTNESNHAVRSLTKQ
ncbi:MAG: hypothetical protein WCW01_03335 [Gammaproteobacteria bacterium]